MKDHLKRVVKEMIRVAVNVGRKTRLGQYLQNQIVNTGMGHLILDGGLSVLQSVKEILIEANDDFHEQAEQCNAFDPSGFSA